MIAVFSFTKLKVYYSFIFEYGVFMNNGINIGNKIKDLRTQKGLTQEELAEALYVSRTAISKWESGRGYPNIDSLKAISKFS